MTQCALQRGFFSLRNCENLMIGVCPQCGRSFCADHSGAGLSSAVGLTAGNVCMECATQTPGAVRRDDRSLVETRRGFYNNDGYVPVILSERFSPDAETAFASKATGRETPDDTMDDDAIASTAGFADS